MSPRIEEAIKSLVQLLREESPENMVTFNLFVNCKEETVTTSERSAEGLAIDGITMRNLRRKFIN